MPDSIKPSDAFAFKSQYKQNLLDQGFPTWGTFAYPKGYI